MDPQVFSILMPLNKMIDDLCKKIEKTIAKQQVREFAIIDKEFDIGVLKTIKVALMEEEEMMRDDWLKAMESFYAVQDYLLTLYRMASPKNPPPNVADSFYLPVFLMKMKEELGQRIADEKVARLARASFAVVTDGADELANVDGLKSEITALTSVLKVLGDDWMNVSTAFHAFVKYFADIGLRVVPGEGSFLRKSQVKEVIPNQGSSSILLLF